jgi:hypothetical protein
LVPFLIDNGEVRTDAVEIVVGHDIIDNPDRAVIVDDRLIIEFGIRLYDIVLII